VRKKNHSVQSLMKRERSECSCGYCSQKKRETVRFIFLFEVVE
jgi:hypothetical protein